MSEELSPALERDWTPVLGELDDHGCAVVEALLRPETCAGLRELYERRELFRKQVVMERHGYGQGEYSYFAYPLPSLVQALREALYPPLSRLANAWSERLGSSERFPGTHADYLETCRQAGQTRPTPLMLKYGPGDFNCLHQDVYGACVFPIQATVLLSRPGEDFTGGEFLVTEQRPRRQSRAEVAPLGQGDAVLFAVRDRPVLGARGSSRARMRHGVSRIRTGRRLTLGIIFHDAA